MHCLDAGFPSPQRRSSGTRDPYGAKGTPSSTGTGCSRAQGRHRQSLHISRRTNPDVTATLRTAGYRAWRQGHDDHALESRSDCQAVAGDAEAIVSEPENLRTTRQGAATDTARAPDIWSSRERRSASTMGWSTRSPLRSTARDDSAAWRLPQAW